MWCRLRALHFTCHPCPSSCLSPSLGSHHFSHSFSLPSKSHAIVQTLHNKPSPEWPFFLLFCLQVFNDLLFLLHQNKFSKQTCFTLTLTRFNVLQPIWFVYKPNSATDEQLFTFTQMIFQMFDLQVVRFFFVPSTCPPVFHFCSLFLSIFKARHVSGRPYLTFHFEPPLPPSFSTRWLCILFCFFCFLGRLFAFTLFDRLELWPVWTMKHHFFNRRQTRNRLFYQQNKKHNQSLDVCFLSFFFFFLLLLCHFPIHRYHKSTRFRISIFSKRFHLYLHISDGDQTRTIWHVHMLTNDLNHKW